MCGIVEILKILINVKLWNKKITKYKTVASVLLSCIFWSRFTSLILLTTQTLYYITVILSYLRSTFQPFNDELLVIKLINSMNCNSNVKPCHTNWVRLILHNSYIKGTCVYGLLSCLQVKGMRIQSIEELNHPHSLTHTYTHIPFYCF